jgi:hypothetical protein
MKSINATILFVNLLWPAVAGAQQSLEATVERVDDSTIMIDGVIGIETFDKLKTKFTGAERKIVVRSEGGVTKIALDIAEFILQKRLDIVVRDYCISSCANYLFVAGNNKVVEPKAVVAWHGGHSNSPFRLGNNTKEYLENRYDLYRREQLLYARVAVSIDLIVYSGWLTVGTPTGRTRTVEVLGEKRELPITEREFTQWVPSADELRRLGVANLTMQWQPVNSAEIDQTLSGHGFKDQRVYTGRAYSHLPAVLNLPKH